MEALKIIIFLFVPLLAQGNSCGTAGNWVQYKDEKCYRLTEDFVTAEDALNVCLFENPTASLPVVKSSEEQQFINNYLYVQNGILDGVWLGATRVNSTQEFAWANGDDLTSYANWAPGYPSEDTTRNCARMTSSLTKSIQVENGEWTNVACGTRNLVLCQKPAQFSHEELVNELLKLRFNFQEAEKSHLEFKEETLSEFEAQKGDLEETTNKLEATTLKLNETREEIEKLKEQIGNNSVPIGFLYFQVGTQPSPEDLWPGYSWEDISSTYEGLFFRVTGGGAAPIGTIQEDNAPRLGGVRYGVGSNHPESISVPSSGSSSFIKAGKYNTSDFNIEEAMSFSLTNIGEVRPINTAMRIWKRT